jgi:hypothetical protein
MAVRKPISFEMFAVDDPEPVVEDSQKDEKDRKD